MTQCILGTPCIKQTLVATIMVKQPMRKLVSLSVGKQRVVDGSTGARKRTAISRHERVK